MVHVISRDEVCGAAWLVVRRHILLLLARDEIGRPALVIVRRLEVSGFH